ncbi:hypothetical protein DFH08DRAFT_817640 [Mycena albidolilacea]|uniref:Uncharacterized protein n=1 Tax=Mycena albidolilacea TaxID=1033008 RepID=A0AAD6ZIJ8_9AGAR|nr:hypothetical protein DFH08DRAFT_817640 [Mycena albidolilacea]
MPAVIVSGDKDSGANKSFGANDDEPEAEHLQPIAVDGSKAEIIKAHPRRKPQPPPKVRFINNTVYSHSITAALFDVIPTKYHSLLDYSEYKHLGKDFIAELRNYRSSMINTLQGVTVPILTSAGHAVDSTILASVNADRSQDKVLLGLLWFPADKSSKPLAPILFPDGKKNLMYIFLSRVVLDLHRVMVHGPSSLAANAKPDPKANGTKYGFVEVTDHSLALAGTFACFLVSADKTFASTGAITKINWEADYRTYKKLLASNRDSPSVKHIFKVNAHVFAGVLRTAGATEENVADADVEDEISEAMHCLAFGDFEDPSNSDNDGAGDEILNVDDSPPRESVARRARITDAPPEIREIPNREEMEEDEVVVPRARTHGSNKK